MAKDYYKTLGVEKNATTEDIKKAYKNLAKKYHPDLNKEAGTTDKFKEVNEAAAILGNPEKRKKYDEYGTADEQQFSGFDYRDFAGGFDAEDIFENFFQGFGSSRGRRGGARKGQDVLVETIITLEEAYHGTKKDLRLQGVGTCDDCNGTGAEEGKFTTCPTCNGHGRMVRNTRTPFGTFQMETTCSTCHGAGKKPETTCRSCRGDGKSRKAKEFTITIPRGAFTGLRLRVSGGGEPGTAGGHPGDLYVQVRVQEHSTFTREEDNLHLERSIPFTTAILGGELTIPTLTGETTLKITAGTQPETILRVRGEGMPNIRGGTGDIYVTIHVTIPTSITEREEELLKEYEHPERATREHSTREHHSEEQEETTEKPKKKRATKKKGWLG